MRARLALVQRAGGGAARPMQHFRAYPLAMCEHRYAASITFMACVCSWYPFAIDCSVMRRLKSKYHKARPARMASKTIFFTRSPLF